jgi:hypothetical protein
MEDLFLGSEDFLVDLDIVGLSFGLGISDTLCFVFIFVGNALGFGLGLDTGLGNVNGLLIRDALGLSLLICDAPCLLFVRDALGVSLLIRDAPCLLFVGTNTKLERFILNRHFDRHLTRL